MDGEIVEKLHEFFVIVFTNEYEADISNSRLIFTDEALSEKVASEYETF